MTSCEREAAKEQVHSDVKNGAGSSQEAATGSSDVAGSRRPPMAQRGFDVLATTCERPFARTYATGVTPSKQSPGLTNVVHSLPPAPTTGLD